MRDSLPIASSEPFDACLLDRKMRGCLRLEPAARNNGAKIWQWPLAFSIQQQWYIGFAPNTNTPSYIIRNNLTFRYIDVEFNGTGNGEYIHQWEFVPGVQSQLWRFERVN